MLPKCYNNHRILFAWRYVCAGLKNINKKDERILKTKIYKIDREHVDEAVFAQAGQILRDGGLVAFPRKQLYGLGANALDEAAAKKKYTQLKAGLRIIR